jgi:hypothetical protein
MIGLFTTSYWQPIHSPAGTPAVPGPEKALTRTFDAGNEFTAHQRYVTFALNLSPKHLHQLRYFRAALDNALVPPE